MIVVSNLGASDTNSITNKKNENKTIAHIAVVITLIAILGNVTKPLISAIEAGGSSLKDFTDIQGNSGYFQFEFYVYGRENEYCKTTNCDRKIKRISQSGRSSFYCPYCQR